MEHLSGGITLLPQLKVTGKVKTFVLDTNVLLHDPQAVFKFEDNNLAIPVEVLEELDTIKGEQSTERGRNARRVRSDSSRRITSTTRFRRIPTRMPIGAFR